MSDGSPALRLERCERIDASARTALVRVRGRWTAAAPVTLGAAQLEVAAGDEVRRFPALPDPAGEAAEATPGGRAWQAAFPLPRELADAASELAVLVEGAPRAVVSPDAGDGTGRAADAAPSRAQLAREREQLRAALADARRTASAAGRARDEAQSRLAAAESRATAAESRREELEAALRRKQPFGATAGPADLALEQRVAQLEGDLRAARMNAKGLGDRLGAAERRLAEATARLREEAEARDRAEARVAQHERGRRLPLPRREAAPPATPRREPPEAALQAEVQALQGDVASARADADELADQLMAARHRLEEAVERLREETEARMRAEARGPAPEDGA